MSNKVGVEHQPVDDFLENQWVGWFRWKFRDNLGQVRPMFRTKLAVSFRDCLTSLRFFGTYNTVPLGAFESHPKYLGKSFVKLGPISGNGITWT